MTIRNDATRQRLPVAEPRPLRQVVARQGQVLLDTDVNESGRLQLDRVESADAAMLGPPDRLLYPAGTSGFLMSGAAPGFNFGAGVAYLNGWQLVNPAACTLQTQPNRFDGTLPSGTVAMVLKALVRHVDPAEDRALADVALGDAQASGRSLLDWQIFPLGGLSSDATCARVTGEMVYMPMAAPSGVELAVSVATAAAAADPCSLTPAGGHTRFENLLYRLEVHDGVRAAGDNLADGRRFRRNGVKLKLSRRNASLMVQVAAINGTRITVTPPALDPRNWFGPGSYAELVRVGDDIDSTSALAAERLFAVANASDDVITLADLQGNAAANVTAAIAATGAVANGRWFLRLWDAWPDGKGLADVPASGGPVPLGDGLSITLSGPNSAWLRRGDFWTFAVRADGSIDWPGAMAGAPVPRRPDGPEIRYAPVGIVGAGLPDCRIPFASLTDRSLLYRGGDGQSAFAPPAATITAAPLPQPLRVAVMRGNTPVPGAEVRWRLISGAPGGWVGGAVTSATGIATTTNADGLAEIIWSIDAAQQGVTHRIEAVLMSGAIAATTPPVQFNARFDSAATTSYAHPSGICPTLAGVTDVQTALDKLCAAIATPQATLQLEAITLGGAKTNTQLIKDNLILNGIEVDTDAFVKGVRIAVDTKQLDLRLQADDPAVEVSIDIPYPGTDWDRSYWAATMPPQKTAAGGPAIPQAGTFGFQTIRLDGQLKVEKSALFWKPSDHAVAMLLAAERHRFGSAVLPQFAAMFKQMGWLTPMLDKVLCRLKVRSALVFADDAKGERRWLNAEHLGTADKITGRELQRRERDPQRAADLDMFIWLALPTPGITFYFGKGGSQPIRSSLGTPKDGLDAIAAGWRDRNRTLVLTAHADESGGAPANLKLSELRGKRLSEAVKALGVPAQAITVEAKGNSAPPEGPLLGDATESPNRQVMARFGADFKP